MTSFGQGKLLSVNLYNATFHTSLWPRQNVLLLRAMWIFFHLMLPWVCPFEFSCILHALYRDKQTIKRSLLKETNSRGQCFSLLLLLPKAKGKKKKHKKKITLISCKLLGTALKTTLFHAVWIWTFFNILPSLQWRMESCDNYSIQLMLNLWTQLISLVVMYEVKMKA